MKQWMRRVFYGLLFALPLMMVTYALAQAADSPTAPNPDLDCAECHQPFMEAWQGGAHGQAMSDPAFQNAWYAAGEPEECLQCHVTGYDPKTGDWLYDGVACQACHKAPANNNPPVEPMSIDHQGETCGQCHAESYFEWQVSGHAVADVDCGTCHDPHMTDLKEENTSVLCASCHQDRSSNFTHSGHSQQGLIRFDHVIQRPALHRLHSHVLVAVAGHNNNRVGAFFFGCRQ